MRREKEYDKIINAFERLTTTSSSKQWYLETIKEYLEKRGINVSENELIEMRQKI
jgi:hypothetical protein